MLVPKIKECRKKAYLTQQQLAEMTGMNDGYISRLETGKVMPTADTLWKIAKAIGCKVDDLYTAE